jgi:tetratricopeptide (TPR) repeat protein
MDQAVAMGRIKAKTLFVGFVALLSVTGATIVWAQDYLDHYEQGEFALRVEKWDRAVEFFSKSVEDNPKFFVAYHNRAIAYSKMGEYDKSIQDLKKALQLNPDYPDAYGLMGLVYEIKKDYLEALKVYQEALSREKRPTVQKVLQKYIHDVESKIKKK